MKMSKRKLDNYIYFVNVIFFVIITIDYFRFEKKCEILREQKKTQTVENVDTQNAQKIFTDGEYFGSANSVKGVIKVKVIVKNNKIENIEFLEENESVYPLGKQAIIEIPQQIIKNQSFDIDTISGATITCKAIIDAARNAVFPTK
ncbi:MAG TPA: FMN-binding protein [bacterium]|nr:FMN-binding protein [bacterium]HPP88605.1 FMN-binding protein [bacterium]